MHRIETTTRINAAPEAVWEVLTNTNEYPAWNPFITRFEGALSVGDRIAVAIRPPGSNGMRFRPRITAFEPGRELRWFGSAGVRGLFDGEHVFRITPSDRGTLFTQSETFTGLLVPFMSKTLHQTKAGFELMNAALRVRAEQHAPVA